MGNIFNFTIPQGTFRLPKQEVSTGDFFHNLSQKDGILWGRGYDKQFHVQSKGILSNHSLYTIFESNRPWKYINPFHWIVQPQTTKEKIETTRNLVGLVNREKESIVKDADSDVSRIIAAFERAREGMVRNTSDKDERAIRNNLNTAIKALQTEDLKYHAEAYAGGRGVGLTPGKASSSSSFYEALTHTWWPRGFNERFQIIEPSKGRFEVHRMSKPWFFQKWAKWPTEITSLKFWKDMAPNPVSGAAKVATAEKLEAMIKTDRNLIRFMQPNTTAMISNLEHIKGRITRNTNTIEKQKIEKGFDGAINELRKIGMLARKDWNKSWTGWILNHTAVPINDWILIPAAKESWKVTKTVVSLPWMGAKLLVQTINTALAGQGKK